ncbi:MAG: sigma-70 family RNA polymerase sigma factor [Planctomycetota bacterium]|nr:sigma-70 family RNA polymerase sigma factor [Planctomycetota bacterium]
MTDWESIVATHSAVVWRTVYRLLGNHQDAADCFQETFLSALDVARRQTVRSWPAMLTCLATSRALDRVRQRMRSRARSADVEELASAASQEPGPDRQAETAELVRMFRELVVQLPDRQAEVICLRYVSQMSYREIAREMGLKSSDVGVLLHRARGRLRELAEPAAGPCGLEVTP